MQDEGRVHKLPKTQMCVGELRKGKVIKEIKLLDGLLKFEQSWVYVSQRKLTLLIFKEKYHSLIANHRGRK